MDREKLKKVFIFLGIYVIGIFLGKLAEFLFSINVKTEDHPFLQAILGLFGAGFNLLICVFTGFFLYQNIVGKRVRRRLDLKEIESIEKLRNNV